MVSKCLWYLPSIWYIYLVSHVLFVHQHGLDVEHWTYQARYAGLLQNIESTFPQSRSFLNQEQFKQAKREVLFNQALTQTCITPSPVQ
jgi:hypothetical protein